jgi:pantoate--beta-alanine ligase
MQVVSSIAAMQRLAKKWRRAGALIGLVPTMGFLHEGHLSLVRQARKRTGRHSKVVVSIYVNPTQFAPTEDFSKYPRDLKQDLKLLRTEGVDVVFVPDDAEMYPDRRDVPAGFSTYVTEEKLSKTMEGVSRPTHFRGVTTVVAKLFNIVLPDVAVFGQKDFQQAAMRIIVAPTKREADGLAMSSRNKYLAGDLRQQATVLRRAIEAAKTAVKKFEKISSATLKAHVKKQIKHEPDARLDYVEFFDPETLVPVAEVSPGTHMALAVFVGKTRLIDNAKM